MRFWLWVLRIMGKLPLPLLRFLGVLLGAVLFIFAHERRAVAFTNLQMCFPHFSKNKRLKICWQHFVVLAQSLLDRGWVWYAPRKLIEHRIRWVDYHYYEHAARTAPLIMLAPHFIGLDAGGVRVSMIKHAASMYSKQKNPLFDAAVVAARGRFNAPLLLSRQDGVRAALRALKQGLSFYYLPDMDFGPRDAEFISFFNVPAATVTAPSRLAKLAQARVIPCVSRMTSSGYEVRWYPVWGNFPTDDPRADTLRMNQFIEQRVLEMLPQYLWTHKRFKTRPAGIPKPY